MQRKKEGKIKEFIEGEKDITSQAIALLSAIGGPFGYWATRIEQRRSAIQHESVQKLIHELQNQQVALGARIDREGVTVEEFYELFQLTVTATAQTTRDTKIRAMARLLANFFLRPEDPLKLTYTEAEHFVRCIDALSADAIQLLGVVAQLVLDKYGRNVVPNPDFSTGELADRIQNMHPDLVMGLIAQLEGWNLVHRLGVPGITQYKNGWVMNQRIRFTSLGMRILDFVIDEGHEHGPQQSEAQTK